MSLNFGEILTRSWQITWKHKVLWIFGILAGCSRGGGGGNSSYQYSQGEGPTAPEFQQFMDQAQAWFAENWWVLVLIGLAFLALILLSIFLGTIGRIGLIRGTLQVEAGAQSLSFGDLFRESIPFFWRVFGLGFLIGLAFFLVIGAMVLIGVLTAGIGFACLLPLICILVIVSIGVGLILEQAFVAIVKEDLGIVDGLKRGWEVARANPGPIIVMALILFVIGLVIGVILIIPVVLIVVPSVVTFAVGNAQDLTPMLIAGILFLLYLPILLVLNGILATYVEAVWTLTYLRLTNKPADNIPVVVEANA